MRKLIPLITAGAVLAAALRPVPLGAAMPSGTRRASVVIGKAPALGPLDRPGANPASRLETAFQHNEINQATLAGMNYPQGVVVDGAGHLFVADSSNNRVLGWPSVAALANGQPATLVIGQPNGGVVRANSGRLYTSPCDDTTLSNPTGLAVDAAGNLYIADTNNHRVVRVAPPFAQTGTRVVFSTVWGHDDALLCRPNRGAGAAANTLSSPIGVALQELAGGAKFLYVADSGNSRVLQYDLSQTDPVALGTADRLWGQPDYTYPFPYSGGGPTNANFNQPAALAVLADGTLAVSDYGSHRVLIFPPVAGQTYAAAAATVVVGQSTASANSPNQGNYTASATSLYTPRDVVLTGSASGLELLVADFGNNRVLAFSGVVANGAAVYAPAATKVAGQTALTANRANNPVPGLATLNGPAGMHAPGGSLGTLWVTDGINNRLLRFGPLGAAGTAANLVIGQLAADRIAVNGPGAPGGLYQPAGLAIDARAGDRRLYVVDSSNHRVLAWRNYRTYQPGRLPDRVIGQPDLNSVARNQGLAAPTAATLNDPGAIAVDANGNLIVADRGNNRVLRFPDPFAAAGPYSANLVLGQAGFTTATPNLNRGITDPNAPCHRPAGKQTDECALWNPGGVAVDGSTVWVADQLNHRLLRYDTLANGAPASRVVGRTETYTVPGSIPARTGLSFYDNGLVLPTARTVGFPVGLAFCGSPACVPPGLTAAKFLWVADGGNNRVLGFDVSNPDMTTALTAARMSGEPDFVTRSGGTSAIFYTFPSALALTPAGDLFIADTGNGRVLGVPAPDISPEPATLLIGHDQFNDSDPNKYGVTRASLFNPRAVACDSDGTVIVADSDNNRLLIYHPQ